MFLTICEPGFWKNHSMIFMKMLLREPSWKGSTYNKLKCLFVNEVPGDSEGDLIPALVGRAHCGDESDVLEELPLLVVQVVPAAHVHLLPQDLQGGLSHEPLLVRHVEVVDEDYHPFLPVFRPETTLTTFCSHFWLDRFLDLVASRLPRKCSYQVWKCLIEVESIYLYFNLLSSLVIFTVFPVPVGPVIKKCFCYSI